jgi:protein-L-isoaspartate O-methyltransferase
MYASRGRGSPTTSAMVDPDALRALLDRDDGRDRAFVDAMIRMAWSRKMEPAKRDELGELHRAVRAASLRSHGAIRTQIADGTLRGAKLRNRFDDVPVFQRDHFVEEVLGIAYPPLEEPELTPGLMTYSPSGYDEIVHAIDVTRLGPGDQFLDVGSGMGKAVMLATLLAGATSTGVECERSLDALARDASHAIGLQEVRFHHGDARDVASENADVVFMYLPFTGSVLTTVMARLIEEGRPRASRSRARFLCAGPLDTHHYPDLVAAGPAKSWLHIYAWR